MATVMGKDWAELTSDQKIERLRQLLEALVESVRVLNRNQADTLAAIESNLFEISDQIDALKTNRTRLRVIN